MKHKNQHKPATYNILCSEGEENFKPEFEYSKNGPMNNVNTNTFIIYVHKREDDIMQRKLVKPDYMTEILRLDAIHLKVFSQKSTKNQVNCNIEENPA